MAAASFATPDGIATYTHVSMEWCELQPQWSILLLLLLPSSLWLLFFVFYGATFFRSTANLAMENEIDPLGTTTKGIRWVHIVYLPSNQMGVYILYIYMTIVHNTKRLRYYIIAILWTWWLLDSECHVLYSKEEVLENVRMGSSNTHVIHGTLRCCMPSGQITPFLSQSMYRAYRCSLPLFRHIEKMLAMKMARL